MGAITLERFAAEQSLGLTRFGFLLCGDRQRAEDLVQDAFLSLYRRFGNTISVDNPLAYARKVVTNGYISAARKRAASEVVTDAVPEEQVDDAVNELWEGLSALSSRQRSVLVLRYWLDQSDEQTAALLGCRPGTVRSPASRAIATLRRTTLRRTQGNTEGVS
ncbi:MAG TPA: SigE family RNA polymerase sigma factor [Jatrophihabitans sp.]|jgi:RNA polymerase sigma-70 factor (sigma-E family)